MTADQRPVIALDVDDTLYEHFRLLMEWHNQTYGTQLTLVDNHPFSPIHWGTAELREATLRRWNAESVEVAVKRVQGFFAGDEFKNSTPFPGAAEAVASLAERYQIVVVTARDLFLEEFTKSWLKAHFGKAIFDVILTARYSLEGKARDKQDVFTEISASYVIDDDLTVRERAANRGLKAVLYGDYPWNSIESLPSGVVRCRNWSEVKTFIDNEVA